MSENVTNLFKVNTLAPSNDDVANKLRALADTIEAGDWGSVDTVVCVIEHAAGALDHVTYGKPIDHARVVGLLTIAAHRAMDGN